MIGEYENDAQKTHTDMSWKYICPSRIEREVKKRSIEKWQHQQQQQQWNEMMGSEWMLNGKVLPIKSTLKRKMIANDKINSFG